MKKKTKSLFGDKEQENTMIQYLRDRGYAVIKIDENQNIDEVECAKKLQMLGYQVVSFKDSLTKLDTQRISSADDIVVYFYALLNRSGSDYVDFNKVKDPKTRVVDRSIVNRFLSWRMEASTTSLKEALNEFLTMINLLFEDPQKYGVKIRNLGVLSVVNNKAFVMSLLRDAHLRMDMTLQYKIEHLIQDQDTYSYLSVLKQSKDRIDAVANETPTIQRRKIGEKRNG